MTRRRALPVELTGAGLRVALPWLARLADYLDPAGNVGQAWGAARGRAGLRARVPDEHAVSHTDPCDIPIGRGQTCTKPGDHLDGCEWPLPRCQCSHGPSVHTGGHGQCWSLSCACSEYRDPVEDAMQRHPAGKAIPEGGAA